ncbi:hypothetical protein EI94DRAFT_1748162 [Lactarius quietus]|nr:hypothetical protein EI94DRAFT_1748162 [Lactarius quietus]
MAIKAVAILLDLMLLHQMISKWVCLGWDSPGSSDIPIDVHMRNLWILVCEVRMILRRIVIVCVDVLWILHITLYNHIPHWLREALSMDTALIITGYVRVLEFQAVRAGAQDLLRHLRQDPNSPALYRPSATGLRVSARRVSHGDANGKTSYPDPVPPFSVRLPPDQSGLCRRQRPRRP